jgi:curved DNA-binding protein CbpA
MRDAHKILSIGRNASLSEIKVAYRRLALQLHPDTNGGDTAKSEQFKKVNEAYTYLTDPTAQQSDIYDEYDDFTSSYSTYRPNHHSSSQSHWNPFQSPFENMKNAQKNRNNKNKNNNPFMDFGEWDDFDFIDFDTGEEVVFGFDKNGKARTSRKQSPNRGGKKKSKSKAYKSRGPMGGFEEFTTEEIEDIIRNSTSPGWGSQESYNNAGFNGQQRSRSKSTDSSSSKRSSSKKGKSGGKGGNKSKEGDNGGKSKSTRSRRRRRGGDDCTIS